jgi:gliding motility-associated protein GldL
MKKLILYFETEKGAKTKNMITCIGAAVVILGALFKITHWPGAMAMLILGMSVEAVLFVMFGVLPPHKEYHWEKYYPGLDISPHAEHEYEGEEHHSDESHGHQAVAHAEPAAAEAVAADTADKSLAMQLDEALSEAAIGPDIIESLGHNLERLGSGLNTLGNMTDVGAATKEFSDKAMGAAQGLEKMGVAYQSATDAANNLATVANEANSYKESMVKLSSNLNALNEMYQMELENGSNTFKSIDNFYSSVNTIMTSLEASAEDTKRYKEEVSTLVNNISSLNNVYGNMLSAMSNPQS